MHLENSQRLLAVGNLNTGGQGGAATPLPRAGFNAPARGGEHATQAKDCVGWEFTQFVFQFVN
jgi:hypothetical protein